VFKFRKITFGSIFHQEAFISSVIGFPHAGLDTDLGGHSRKDQMADREGLQTLVQVGGLKRPFAGFVDDEFARFGTQLLYKIISGFSQYQDSSHRPRISDAERGVPTASFGRRAI
jgi:hypothetical protein